MALKIEPLTKGDSTRTARHADVMNEIIDKVNLLLAMSVSPQGSGKFLVSDSNIVLDASKFGGTVSVSADVGGEVSNVSLIQFTIADDPSAGYIEVVDGGGGTAIIKTPVLPTSPGGFTALVDDGGSTQWQATEECECGGGSGIDGGGA
jgi:hypothetical protein